MIFNFKLQKNFKEKRNKKIKKKKSIIMQLTKKTKAIETLYNILGVDMDVSF